MTEPFKPNIIQQAALDALTRTRAEGKQKALVVMPTGTGKTHLAVFDCQRLKAKRILFIVHRREILEQAQEAFNGLIGSNNKAVFSTIQTLSRPNHLARIAKMPFDYVILDEFHHAPAPTYKRVLATIKTRFLLGLTATPFRLDISEEKELSTLVDDNLVYKSDLKEAIDLKILSNFQYIGLKDNIDYSDLHWNGYKYKQSELDRKLLIDKRDAQIFQQFKRYCNDRKTLGFCNSVKHANHMALKFNEAGIRSIAITVETPLQKRKQFISEFRNGIYQTIFTKDIFNEGVDFPDVSALLFLRPTLSQTIWLQQLGRGLRKLSTKNNVVILDFIGNYHNANKVKEWLAEVGRYSYTSPQPHKPEYHMIVSEYYFEPSLIQLFDSIGVITKEQVLVDIIRVHKQLGHSPTAREYNAYGCYSSGSICRHFSTHNKALIAAGLVINKEAKHRLEDIIIDIQRVAKALGHTPSVKHYKLYGHYPGTTVSNHFGTWNEALEQAGLVPLKASIDKNILILKLQTLATQLGHIPRRRDLTNHSEMCEAGTYARRFGSFNKALILAGFKPNKISTYTDSEIIAELKQIASHLNHTPSSTEYREFGNIAINTVLTHFGTWKKALKAAGLS